ncbi:MAG: hypothetical protein ACREQQ_08810, partial [Candidatus Binatia bacterium]
SRVAEGDERSELALDAAAIPHHPSFKSRIFNVSRQRISADSLHRQQLLPLTYAERGMRLDGTVLSAVVRPFAHAAGYVAAERRAVLLRNYEADSKVFPLLFRHEVDPYFWIPGLGGSVPGFVFENYAKDTPGTIDYVLEWQALSSPGLTARRQPVVGQLVRGYQLVFESKPNGFLRIFRARGLRRYPGVE